MNNAYMRNPRNIMKDIYEIEVLLRVSMVQLVFALSFVFAFTTYSNITDFFGHTKSQIIEITPEEECEPITSEVVVVTNKLYYNHAIMADPSFMELQGDEIFEPVIEEIPEEEVEDTVAYRMEIDEETYNVLLRVVEAEVTGEKYKYKGNNVNEEEMKLAKIRVAQVFMNRVENDETFSCVDNLYDALTYPNASSSFNDGRYYTVEITDLTKEAVEEALDASTPDYTNGALYFAANSVTEFYGTYLFTDEVGHSFFK